MSLYRNYLRGGQEGGYKLSQGVISVYDEYEIPVQLRELLKNGLDATTNALKKILDMNIENYSPEDYKTNIVDEATTGLDQVQNISVTLYKDYFDYLNRLPTYLCFEMRTFWDQARKLVNIVFNYSTDDGTRQKYNNMLEYIPNIEEGDCKKIADTRFYYEFVKHTYQNEIETAFTGVQALIRGGRDAGQVIVQAAHNVAQNISNKEGITEQTLYPHVQKILEQMAQHVEMDDDL